MLTTPLIASPSSVAIGKNYAYTFSGDYVQLEADLTVSSPETSAVSLQLWACASPFTGGILQGVKVAEVLCDAMTTDTHISERTQAYVPAGHASYFMVLVLVANVLGEQQTIISYAGFARPQQFLLPRMSGNISFQIENDAAEVTIDTIENPRDSKNVSGTLALELWSLTNRYEGASFNGVKQGSVLLGTLLGQTSWLANVIHINLASKPIVGNHLVLMLREWVGNGYITRDYYHLEQQEFSAPVEGNVVASEHPVMDWIEKVESVIEAVTPFVETVAHSVGSVVSALVDVAEQIIEEAEREIEPEPKVVEEEKEEAAKPVKKTATRKLKPAPEPKVILSLNTITEEQLVAVKGISNAVAKAIIDGRPYARWGDVSSVKGVGGKLLIKLKAHFVL